MKKIFTFCILGAFICSCKTTFNNHKLVDSVLKSDKTGTDSQYCDGLKLYYKNAAYTGNRSTYLSYFEEVLVKQPTDTTEMHLVALKVTRKWFKNSFRKGEKIGVFVQQTHGIDVKKWKLAYEYQTDDPTEVTIKTTVVAVPARY